MTIWLLPKLTRLSRAIQGLEAAETPEERGLRSSREAAATITDPFIAVAY